LELALGCQATDEEIQHRAALQLVGFGDRTQMTSENIYCSPEFPLSGKEFSNPELCRRLMLDLFKDLFGLFPATLAPAQAAEKRERADSERGHELSELAVPDCKVLLRLRPVAAPHQDSGVVWTADRKDDRETLVLAEVPGRGTPLPGPVKISDSLAGAHQCAKSKRGGSKVMDFMAEDHRGGLVQAFDGVSQVAHAQTGVTFGSQGKCLNVRLPESSCKRCRSRSYPTDR
jgi:hypothetical protein